MCNVRGSIYPVDRQQQWHVAGLLLSVGACRSYWSVVAGSVANALRANKQGSAQACWFMHTAVCIMNAWELDRVKRNAANAFACAHCAVKDDSKTVCGLSKLTLTLYISSVHICHRGLEADLHLANSPQYWQNTQQFTSFCTNGNAICYWCWCNTLSNCCYIHTHTHTPV